MSQLFPG